VVTPRYTAASSPISGLGVVLLVDVTYDVEDGGEDVDELTETGAGEQLAEHGDVVERRSTQLETPGCLLSA
jgi:hypothetical protein